MNGIYLSALINVFNVVPTFLLPVFSDGRRFYFQVLENNTILRFEEAEMSQFLESPAYQILDRFMYAPESPAVYGIDMPGGKYVYGNSDVIADAYYSNLKDFTDSPAFIGSMTEFLRETGADVSYAANRVGNESLIVNPTSLNDLLDLPYITAQSLAKGRPDITHSKLLSDLAIASIFSKTLNRETRMSHFVKLIGNINILENLEYAICEPDKNYTEITNIFKFRYLSNNPTVRYHVKYCKAPHEFPVELQIKILDTLFHAPGIYFKKEKHLWDYDAIEKVYLSKYRRDNFLRYLNPMPLRKHLEKWGLYIECPKRSYGRNISDYVGNYWAQMLPGIEEIAEMEDALLFWFEIKALSTEVYALIAQDYYASRNYFRLKEDTLSSEDLINFITGLYYDVNRKKVMLLQLRSERFSQLFNENLSDWLSENEDKCVIRDIYHDIREYYE